MVESLRSTFLPTFNIDLSLSITFPFVADKEPVNVSFESSESIIHFDSGVTV